MFLSLLILFLGKNSHQGRQLPKNINKHGKGFRAKIRKKKATKLIGQLKRQLENEMRYWREKKRNQKKLEIRQYFGTKKEFQYSSFSIKVETIVAKMRLAKHIS